MTEILNNFYKPQWWPETAIPFAIGKAKRKFTQVRYTPSAPICNIMDEDWDNLILLDACRFDQFNDSNSISGKLELRTSLGSATPEFLTKNFEGATHYDTVYLTANPMYRTQNLEDVFHEVIDVWEMKWDEEYKTVRPNEMVEATIEAHESFPDKRIISHFMQPHYPFIGESAKEIGNHAGYELTYRKVKNGEGVRDHSTVWELLDKGEVDEETVWRAYNENLEIVLSHAEKLVEKFDEKTVITSDHGNLVKDRVTPIGSPMSGHPPNMYTDELRKVPWLVLEGETRKQIQSEQPREGEHEESEIVTERLADLGYAE